METNILFKEYQKFKQWWLWFILLSIDIVFIAGTYSQIILKKPFGNNPMNDGVLLAIDAFSLY